MTARRCLALGVLAAALVSTTATAEAQTVRLTLDQVFGSSVTSLTIPFGGIDAQCMSAPSAGVTCYADPSGAYATWYGTVQFRVRLTGGGQTILRLVGVRSSAATMPIGRLLDSASSVPTTPYPISPSTPITLATAIPKGNTPISRSIGVQVVPVDVAGTWTTSVVYSLIVE